MTEGVDTTVLAAFAVGFVSFISPCVLPMVPGYLSAVSGVSLADMKSGSRKVVLPAIAFCLSFTVVFVALGMTATGLGSALNDNRATLDKIAGVLIMAMGALFLAMPFVPRLNREWRIDALMARAGTGGPLVAGAAFAFAWTPCVGPTLGAVLGAAASKDTVDEGAFLLLAYSLGLAVPFVLSAIAFTRVTGLFRWLRDHYLVITAISGVILVAMGFLLFTGELTRLNIEVLELMERLGLNFFREV